VLQGEEGKEGQAREGQGQRMREREHENKDDNKTALPLQSFFAAVHHHHRAAMKLRTPAVSGTCASQVVRGRSLTRRCGTQDPAAVRRRRPAHFLGLLPAL
jgi:hypothetical protein